MEIEEDSSNEMQSDSSDDEEENAERAAKAMIVEQKIAENNYDYDSHVELISLLRQMAEFEKLRSARELMSKFFPLTAALWMDWLTDEIKIATTEEEKDYIVKLFDRAIEDYLSVDIWLEYVQFSIGLHAAEKDVGLEKIRKVFERALTAAGLHVTKGALLWEAYIEFELMILSMQQESSAPADDIQNQQKRIANLFRRQLSCPLLQMEETLKRFNSWLVESTGSLDSNVIDRNFVESTYKTARQKLSKIEEFEDKLLAAPENLESYIEYLKLEKSKEGSPARVLCLYERAIANLCLHDSLWLEYMAYVDVTLNDGTLALSVAKRGIRNCPWSSQLATAKIRLLEKYKASHEEITVAVEQALATGLTKQTDFRDVWLCYLEYARRRYDAPDISKEVEEKRLDELQAAFTKASDYLNRLDDADPDCSVLQFWARVEAKIVKDMEKARILWNDILADPSRKTAAMWLEYICLETAYGDSKHLRKLYPRALQQVTDWPEMIYTSWLNFERDEGTLESYNTCISKCQVRITEVIEKRNKDSFVGNDGNEKHVRDDYRKPKRAGVGFGAKEKMIDVGKSEFKVRKRKLDDFPSDGSPEKKKKIESNNGPSTKDIVDNLLSETNKDHGVSVKHDSSKDNRTVFVSNLDYTTSDDAIREAFSPDGNITDLRLVKDFKGRSKGYCYVEFEKIESAMKAIKRDRALIGGRPMFVSKCDPDKETRQAGLRYSTKMEKNKLFVRGLPFKTTIDEIREMFGKYGTIKDVRLVTYRNGHSKGLAYVDFEDEVSAAQAVLKINGTTIGENTISVAISNPPSRQKPEASSAPVVACLGGGAKQFGPRGTRRPQISFLPRSLQLSSASSAASPKALENLTLDSPMSTTSSKSQ